MSIFDNLLATAMMGEGGGGGGGSSDFSTAQVTFIPDSSSPDGSGPYELIWIVNDVLRTADGANIVGPMTAVLYKGVAYADVSTVTSVSGNATIDNGMVIITGDCAIHYVEFKLS